jgi:uncharacterized membrane-anchored protein
MKLFERPLTRLIAVVALQALILLSILAFKQYTVWTSETILLRLDTTNPQTLVGRGSMPARYDISRVDTRELPGDDEFAINIYVELQEGADGIWEPVAVHDNRDHSFEGTVLIKGENQYAYGSLNVATYDLHYGIENVYIAEEATGIPSGSGHIVALEVRVDRFGNAVPKRFLIDGQPFGLKRD